MLVKNGRLKPPVRVRGTGAAPEPEEEDTADQASASMGTSKLDQRASRRPGAAPSCWAASAHLAGLSLTGHVFDASSGAFLRFGLHEERAGRTRSRMRSQPRGQRPTVGGRGKGER